MNQAVGNGEQGREPSAAPQPDVEPQKMSLPPANNPTVPKVSREKRILKFVKDWGGVATVLIAILYTFPFDAAGRFIHWREQSLLDARKVLSEVAALYGAGTVAAANIQDAQARSFLLGTYNIRIYNALLQDRAVIKAAENKLLPSELYMIGSLYSLMGLSDGIPYYKLAISKSKNDDEKVTIYREMGDALFRPGSYQDIAEARVDYDQALSIASKIPYQQMTYIQYAAELGQLELLYGDWKCGQTVTSYVVGLLDPVISANVPQQLKDLDTGLHSSLATFIQPGPNQPSNGCTNPLPLLETNLGVGATRPPSNALGPTNALNSATSVLAPPASLATPASTK